MTLTKLIYLTGWCALFILALAFSAQAYVGPGPGLSMLGSLFTLLGGIVLALVMVLIYPIRLLIKHRKNRNPSDGN